MYLQCFSVVLMGFDQGESLVGDLRRSFCQSLVDRLASLLIGANFLGFKSGLFLM